MDSKKIIKKIKSDKYGLLKTIVISKKSMNQLLNEKYIHFWIKAKYYNLLNEEEYFDDQEKESLYLKLLRKYEFKRDDIEIDKNECIELHIDHKKYNPNFYVLARVGEINKFMNEEGDKTRIRLDIIQTIIIDPDL